MRTNAGLTLVEVLISSVILAAVIAITMSIVFSMTRTGEREMISSDLDARGRQFVDNAKREFHLAKFTGSSIKVNGTTYAMGFFTSHTELRYRMPSSRDPNGNIKFGYDSPLSPPNHGLRDDLACFIRFEADTVYRESASAPSTSQPAAWGAPFPPLPALKSQVISIDINKDKDKSDTFVRGKVRKYVVAPDGHALLGAHANPLSVETLCDYVILQIQSSGVFNLPDRLFNFVDATGATVAAASSASRIIVAVWNGNWDINRRDYMIRLNSEGIALRNTQ